MIPFHIATPQGCNIQTFYGSSSAAGSAASASRHKLSWVKPVGVSHVYMLLIGSGGIGAAGTGGGSGAVTVWYGAAQHVPNKLDVFARGQGDGSDETTVSYTTDSGTPYLLLKAEEGTGITAGAATLSNFFGASGFYQSVAGQSGLGTAQTPSATTFLSGGSGATTQDVVANYGCQVTSTGGTGFFQMQPIIVGVASSGQRNTAVGCGTGISGTSAGQGMVLIASW